MTVAKKVVDELNQAGIANLGRAYPYNIPASSLVNADKALLAISEVMQLPTEHGSNTYNQVEERIQVKICYPKSKPIDADDFEKSIASFFIQRNWLRQPDNGHYIDDQDRVEIDLFFKRRN